MDWLREVKEASVERRKNAERYEKALAGALEHHTAIEIAEAAGLTRQMIYLMANRLGVKPQKRERKPRKKREPRPRKLVINARYAQQAVSDAIRSGKLVRQPCEICGSTEQVEAHHEDYAKRLEVRWLCNKHHRELHAQRRAAAT